MKEMHDQNNIPFQGILPVNKPNKKTSFSLVGALRRHLKVAKIGHAGTLDPFATGVMVMLIGRSFTRLSDQFLHAEKEYLAKMHFGFSTDTFDCEGKVIKESLLVPSLRDIELAIQQFQGEIEQIPPMFSAKKIKGKKLYELARKGQSIERAPVKVNVKMHLIGYNYPFLDFSVVCSKGTYIRSIANDLGELLGCGGHLVELKRLRSGSFSLENCLDGALLFNQTIDIKEVANHMIL